MKFQATITRTFHESGTVEFDADDLDDAKAVAFYLATEDGEKVAWGGQQQAGDVDVTKVEAVE